MHEKDRRVPGGVATLILLVVALVSCGSSPADESLVAGEDAPAAARFATCAPAEGEVDHATPEALLSMVESWLRVASVDTPPDVDDDDATVQVRVRGSHVGPDRIETPESDHALRAHSTFLPGLRWGAEQTDGTDVYVALAGAGDAPLVATALVVDAEGVPTFVGDCANRQMNEPLAAALGGDFDETIAALPGLTGEEIVAVLQGDPTGPVEAAPQVGAPEQMTDEEIQHVGLPVATLVFDVPDAMVGASNLLCLRVELGWVSCIDLSSSGSAPLTLETFLDDGLSVSLWLLGEDEDFLHPLRELGEVTLERPASTEDEAVVLVAIDGSFDAAGEPPLSDPQVSVARAATIPELEADPSLAQEFGFDPPMGSPTEEAGN